MPAYPEGYWIEEIERGTTEHIIIMFQDIALGTIMIRFYEEKVIWYEMMERLNSMLEKLPKG